MKIGKKKCAVSYVSYVIPNSTYSEKRICIRGENRKLMGHMGHADTEAKI
ncbi:hypothetical protein LCGC14_0357910 [marine sediment metagenome]|uniref:Uncharacterized protein n=1 Tax=marine sediment metagenome TaxID=412755 RepID=A0A0F9VW25_9ZZZZ